MNPYRIAIFMLLCFICISVGYSASDNGNDTNNADNSKIQEINDKISKNAVNSEQDTKQDTKTFNKNNPKNSSRHFIVHELDEFANTVSEINNDNTFNEYTIDLSNNYTDELYPVDYVKFNSGSRKSVVINGNNKIICRLTVGNSYSVTCNNIIIKNHTEDSYFRLANKCCGAIANFGNLTLNNCTFIENAGYDYNPPLDWPEEVFGIGGVIDNEGNLTVTNSVFKKNYAGISGSAIASEGSGNRIILINNTFESNFFMIPSGFTMGTVFAENSDYICIINNSFINNSGDVSSIYIGGSKNVKFDNNKFTGNKGLESIITVNSSHVNLFNLTFFNNTSLKNIIDCYNSTLNLSSIKASLNNGTYFLYNPDNSVINLKNSSISNKMEVFNHNRNNIISSDNYKLENRLNTSITLNRTSLKVNQISVDVNLTNITGKITRGSLIMKLNNKEIYNKNFTGNRIIYTFKDHDLKTVNNLTVIYKTDMLYKSVTKHTIYTRKIINTQTSINHTKVRPKSYVLLNASVTNKDNILVNEGQVVFKINGVTLKDKKNNPYYVNVKNGFAQLKYYVGLMSTKNYTFTAVYKGSINFNTSRENNLLTVHKNKTIMTVVINPSSVVNGRNIEFTAYITRFDGKPVNGGKVAFKLNGITMKDKKGNPVYIPVVNGKANSGTTILPGTSAKTYRISAVYSGTTENFEARTGNYTFNVLKDNINVVLSDSYVIVQKGEKASISGRVLNSENYNTRRNHKIAVKINNKTVLHTLAVNGTFNFTLDTSKVTGLNDVNIIVGENNAYYERRLNIKLFVAK